MPLPLRAAPPPPRQRGRWTGGAEGPSVPGPRSRSPELGSVPAPAPLPAPSRLSRPAASHAGGGPSGFCRTPSQPGTRSRCSLCPPPPAYRAALFGFHSMWALLGGWALGAGGRAHRPWGPKSVADRPPSPGLQFCRRGDGLWWHPRPPHAPNVHLPRSSPPFLAGQQSTLSSAASAVGIVSGGRSLVPTPTGRVCVPAPPLTWAAGAPSVPRFTHARREQGADSAASRVRWLPAACWGRGACSGRLSGPRREPGASGFEGRVGQRRMY